MPFAARLLGLTIGLFGLLLVPSVASAIDEFPVGPKPGGITTGPDGALWFTEEGDNANAGIGRLTTSGVYTRYPIAGSGIVPDKITTGPDGALWFTEFGGNRIGRIDTAGNITEFSNAGGNPSGITAGPGGLWYTAQGSNSIRRITVNGTIDAIYPITTSNSEPSDIVFAEGRLWFTESHPSVNKIGALDPSIPPAPSGQPQPIVEYGTTAGSEPSGIIVTAGGILWFTEPGINAIGRITTAGALTEFPGAGVSASGIAAGRDGALWYTLGFAGVGVCTPGPGEHAIGRITSAGSFTNKFATPTPSSDPSDITEGPDGALWFTEYCGNKVGRIVTAPDVPVIPPPPPVAVLSVSSIKLSPNSFRAAPKGASISKKKKRKAKAGTRVSYTLSRAASTKFTVERAEKGRKKGKKCVAPRPSNKKGRKCTRYVLAKGSFTHKGAAGKNRFKFSGRVGKKRLKPGNYHLNAVATAGPSKSKLKRANFKIIR
jgi:virginiamycin B lyase